MKVIIQKGSAKFLEDQGPVVQNLVSLTSSLRGQLVRCFKTLLLKTLIFFVEKNERGFCNAKASHVFFQQKYRHISDIYV